MKAVGNTHNRDFAHAVTDFAISTGLCMDGPSVAPPVGPTYLPELTQAAIDHTVPLFKLMLSDAANLSEELGGFPRSAETSELLDRADLHWQANPIHFQSYRITRLTATTFHKARRTKFFQIAIDRVLARDEEAVTNLPVASIVGCSLVGGDDAPGRRLLKQFLARL